MNEVKSEVSKVARGERISDSRQQEPLRPGTGRSTVFSVCNESVNFSLENSASLLEFPTISRWLHCFVADSLQTESTYRSTPGPVCIGRPSWRVRRSTIARETTPTHEGRDTACARGERQTETTETPETDRDRQRARARERQTETQRGGGRAPYHSAGRTVHWRLPSNRAPLAESWLPDSEPVG